MATDRIYKATSIGRPLDPVYPTNRAVLLIVPFAGVVAAAVAGLRGAGLADVAIAGLVGIAVAVGSWALARELAPDDDAAAFVAMALAYATYLAVGSPSILLLFTCLLVVRVVNRTSGLAARISDSLVVLVLTLATMYATRSPLLGAVGALAFAFDAELREPLRRQWVFAALCLAGAGVYAAWFGTGIDDLATPTGVTAWLVAAISLLYAVSYFRTRRVAAVGDVSGEALATSRVRAGMFIALLVAAQALTSGPNGTVDSSAVWAMMAGVGIAGLRMKPRHRAGRS
ncbi:MAG: hypothetical protein JSW46_12925 [Gemmatimonadota bacterium]|nr:MAG: hypothetical protein JSW46_12925 [Gemmatimonadota bacterium]